MASSCFSCGKRFFPRCWLSNQVWVKRTIMVVRCNGRGTSQVGRGLFGRDLHRTERGRFGGNWRAMVVNARGGRSSLVIGPYTSSIPDHTRGAVCVYTCVDRHIHYTCVEGSVRKSRECKSVDKEAPVANIYKMEVTSVTSSTSSPGATVQIRTSSYAPCTGLHSSAEC